MKRFLFIVIFSLIPGLVHAAIFYVAKTGNNNYSCVQAQSATTPKLTITAGITCLSGGDTLVIKEGTYAELISYYSTPLIPSGSSWDSATTIQAADGETVVLKPTSSDAVGNVIALASGSYIIFQHLIIDSSHAPHGGVRLKDTAHHIRFVGGEIRNAPTSNGVFIQDSRTSFNEFINIKVYNNGNSKFHQGFYVRGSDNLIDGCEVYNNAGYGMQIYTGDTSRTIVRNNIVYNNLSGMLLTGGTGIKAYNNVVYKNARTGIEVDWGSATNTQIYHNTLYRNGAYPIVIVTQPGETILDTKVINNIYWDHPHDMINTGTNTIILHNLLTEPGFVDAMTHDFRLQPTSSAIDAGLIMTDVPHDIDGILRSHGTAPDIGAYEFTPPIVGVEPFQPPTNLRIVNYSAGHMN